MSKEKPVSFPPGNFILLFILFLVVGSSFALAAPPGNDFEKALQGMGRRIECQQMDFNQREVEKCMQIYQSCMTPDRRPSEQKKCIIDFVSNNKNSPPASTTSTSKEIWIRPAESYFLKPPANSTY